MVSYTKTTVILPALLMFIVGLVIPILFSMAITIASLKVYDLMFKKEKEC